MLWYICPHALTACVHMPKYMCPYTSYLFFLLGEDDGEDEDKLTAKQLFGSSSDDSGTHARQFVVFVHKFTVCMCPGSLTNCSRRRWVTSIREKTVPSQKSSRTSGNMKAVATGKDSNPAGHGSKRLRRQHRHRTSHVWHCQRCRTAV